MSLVSRASLRSAMRGWVAGSSELGRLQDAMRILFPGHRRPSVAALAEAVLLSAVRQHEGATRNTLSRLNESLSRLMDDVDALSHGRSVEGRTPTMRTDDLQTIEQALRDLNRLEDRIRHALDTDPSGSWADQLRIELEIALHGNEPGRGTSVGGAARPPLPRPRTVADATEGLRRTLNALGASAQGIWHSRQLPSALRRAAHDLVVAAGGDVATAVRRILDVGGPQADAMTISILWAEGHIAPGRPTAVDVASAVHQRRISGLDFEWMGQFNPNTWNGRFDPNSVTGTLGIDHIANGRLVDAKHTGVPIEALPHLTQSPAPRTPAHEQFDFQPGVDTHIASSERTRSLAAEERAWDEARHDYLTQMRRQLEFARSRGLRGIEWVCNTAELADAFRILSNEVPAGERAGVQLIFRVGGTP